ncbi:MAG: right-handed parallel beta-helix repeat-containing protein [Planctomycetes bacterium]|nr:right-handed parallel beta-helix repeat-containing protein [Planctomycetota bacterium]
MGYHYPRTVVEHELVIIVDGPGTVAVDPGVMDPNNLLHDPNNDVFAYKIAANSMVLLTAIPAEGYRVRSWLGTEEEPAWNRNTNFVSLDGDKVVRVEFEQDITHVIKVPLEYATIQEAISAAGPGGTNVVVSEDVHYVTNPSGIDFEGKSITLMSTDPENPEVVAATIIEAGGSRYFPRRAFHFHSGEDANTVVTGITIRGGYIVGAVGLPGRFGMLVPEPYETTWREEVLEPFPPRAEAGQDVNGVAYGGAILCEYASSPTIKNCIITDNTVVAAYGGNGAQGTVGVVFPAGDDIEELDDGQWGGHGGSGTGYGYGGGIACRGRSSPIITNCIIRNNIARGGTGGDGGNGGIAIDDGYASNGGNGGAGIGDGMGGGIYAENGSNPVIIDCMFINNHATTGLPAPGGLPGWGAPREPTAPPPPPVVAEGFDGPVFSFGGIAGGAIYYSNTDANLSDNTFIGNRAYIAQQTMLPAELVVLPEYAAYIPPPDNDNFHYLSYVYEPAPVGAKGGAIGSGVGNSVAIANCEFIDSFGGAVSFEPNCTVDVGSSLFQDNSEAVAGGAISVGEIGFASINACEFIGNSATLGGGVIDTDSDIVVTGCLFRENEAGTNGGAIDAHFYYTGSDPNISSTLAVTIESCSFLGNQAIQSATGWGGAVHMQDFVATVNDCYFLDNSARSGGALHMTLGDVRITGGMISGNTSIGGDSYEMGGGVVCADMATTIEDCILSDNVARGVNGSGGAINLYGSSVRNRINNCLITGNSATAYGGAISSYLLAMPKIGNCTFSDNSAGIMGGAIYCDWSCEPIITDSIFQNCDGYAIVEVEGDSGKAVVEHSLFYNNADGDYGLYDRAAGQIHSRTATELDVTNIEGVPLFATGPFGDFYLNQSSSPAVDSGSDSAVALGMDIYTTDLNELGDGGQVDIGYHYSIDRLLAPIYSLTIGVEGDHGTVELSSPEALTEGPAPGTYAYYAGTDVTLIATPEAGYRVATWSATDDERGWNQNTINEPRWNLKSIDVTMYSHRVVTVKFEPDVSRVLKVPEEYTTIELAVADANSGDIIFVSQGTHYISDPNGIDFAGKSITLTSTDPDDPNVISRTIIDCQGAKYFPKRAFQFHSGEEPTAVVTGFTIRNGLMSGPIGETGRYAVYYPIPYQRIDPRDADSPPRAERGKDVTGEGYGGAILCENGSSPTIENCVITDCIVTGAVGGYGAMGVSTTPPQPEWYYIPFDLSGDEQDFQSTSDGQWGGDGGDGTGVGYGGAIACLEQSSPIIRDCIIRNNAARGGWGGTGGPGGSSHPAVGGAASWGGNGGYSYGGGVGGGIYCDDRSVPIITDCNFIDNFATTGPIGVGGPAGSGAPLAPPLGPAGPGADGYAYNYYFGIGLGFGYVNIAGGAIYYDENSDANIVNCIFSGNKAYDTYTGYDLSFNFVQVPMYTVGGALYSVADNIVELNNCDFIGNLAGAVYCEPGCILDFDNCLFEENSDTVTGGAIYVSEGALADINDCRFVGNSASGDGGAVGCFGNADFMGCSFAGNRAGGNGGAIEAYYNTYDPNTRVILRLNFESCGFAGNKAVDGIYAYGGAVHFQDFDATFTDCYFLNNTAKSGGGLFLTMGTFTMTGGLVNGNRALGASGLDTSSPGALFDLLGRFGEAHWIDLSASVSMGGGMVFADAHATIENSILQDNTVESVNGAGGAINFYGGNVDHLIKNCLLTGNSASAAGGAIASAIYSTPEIQNCTFVNNSSGKLGGAVYSDWTTQVVISDSIFESCGSVAIAEEDFGGDVVKHCLFNNNADGDYGIFDSVTEETATSSGPAIDVTNIASDPLFAAGPLGDYYLSQTAAGQGFDSPAVDGGSGSSLVSGMIGYTTRTDSFRDMGAVDIGYHYLRHMFVPQFSLTTAVLGEHGSVEPISGPYYAGTPVTLTAAPETGYRVGRWSGTADDISRSNTNVVVMLRDSDVTVEFDKPRTFVVVSDANYTSVQRAIDAAVDGDVVLVPTGTYDPPYPGFPYPQITITIDKGITLSSFNPDDPCAVAATIFDNVIFEIQTVDTEAIIDGLTITHSRMHIYFCSPTVRNCVFTENHWFGLDGGTPPCPADGIDGVSVNGGAMAILNGSPVVQNCVFSDCSATGGDGGQGANCPAPGADGGWAGWAYGGAVYMGYGSNPIFSDCTFVNCFAMGGNGGDGGNDTAVPPIHGGRGGNYIWSPSEETGPFTFPNWYWWPGWDWGPYDADGVPVYYGGYYKDYWKYSGHGGAVYIENDSNPQFIDCNFVNNHTYGGVSGLGGIPFPTPDVRMTIENFGGAVYTCYGSAPEFTRCNFTDNTADTTLDPNMYVWPDAPEDVYVSYGGTIASQDGTSLRLVDCTITGGDACIGGGIYWSNSEMTIVDCNVSESTAYHGAGLYSTDANGTITDTTVTRNHAYIEPFTIPTDANGVPDPNAIFAYDPGTIFGQGGGYYCLSSEVDIADSVFADNQASASGGGIYYGGSDELLSDSPLLHNSLLTGNRANRDGGGVSVNWFAGLTISNCTITDNVVSGSIGEGAGLGGGLYCSYKSSVEVINSIIWDNFAIDGAQIAIAAGSTYQPSQSALNVIYTDIGPPFDPNQLRLDIGNGQDGLGTVLEGDGGPRLVDAQSIYDQFDAGQERVDVIVTLVDPAEVRALTNWDSAESVSVLRAEIARRQSMVMSSLNPAEFTSKYTYENLSALSGEVTIGGLTKLLDNPAVAYIEPVRYVHPMLRQAISLAAALEVRRVYDGTGIAIAVVDSGVDYTHPMLGGGGFPNTKVIGGYDTAMGDRDPIPVVEPHGTAVAGIAAGSLGEFGDYIGGVAPNAKIYALKIGTDAGAIPTNAGLAAWDWCITHRNDDPANPLKVITNSWGIYSLPFDDPHVADAFSPAYTHAADTAVGLGITILAASGNDGFPGWGIAWPSAISKVISVGGVDDTTDQVMGYSNTAEMMDILAPADPMYTLDIVGPAGYTAGDYFPFFNGTSSACPFAAGAVACIQQAAQAKLGRYLTPAEVRHLLIVTGDPVTDTKIDMTKPRINLGRAITGSSGPPIYVEKGCTLNDWVASDSNSYWAWDPNWDPDSGNIEEDPFFIAGYYLSQIDTGQIVESNCVDGGSDLASNLGLDTYTTRVDGVNDVNVVDMGYHCRQGLAIYELTVIVVEDLNDPGIHGAVEPNSGLYYDGTIVTLTAHPDEGYYLMGWYDVNDVRVSFAREYDIVMDSNQVFYARFRVPVTIEVSGGGEALYDAVTVANNGDTLIVAAGTYNADIDFRGKELRLFSTNPDDPNVVANTIIDCQNSTRGFTFDNGEGPGTLIDGFTIINGGLFAEPGGGIYIGSDTSPTIVNVMIRDCNVAIAGGGGIYVDANSSPLFKNVTVSNCYTILGGGGGVYVDVNSTPTFRDCTIIDCSTEGYGGAAYCNNESLVVFTDCNFISNSAAFSGGALYHASFSTSVLSGCSFTRNTAASGGGGIYYNISCAAEVSDCNFGGNIASDEGGGILCGENSSINVVDSNFVSNSADSGAGLYLDPNCSATITQSILVHNDANEDGGGIYFTDCNVVSIADCNIALNTSARGGGIFSVDSLESTIVNCWIKHNEAVRVSVIVNYFLPDPNDPNASIPVDPGDPNFDPTDPNLIIVTIQDANGTAQGGGIYSFAGPRLIADCHIIDNTTSTSGGGMYLAGDSAQEIDNCLIAENTSVRDGGGISSNWFNDLLISNCTIYGNVAGDVNDPNVGGYGGGLYCSYESTAEVINSIIWGNVAFSGTQIHIGTGFEPDPRPATVNVSYSDVMGWQLPGGLGVLDSNSVFVDVNCVLGWDSGSIIDEDPLFVGGYYLSHVSAGQAVDSPAINAGNALAAILGLDELTTALTGEVDTGTVDLGYHYPVATYRLTIIVVGDNGTFTIDPYLDSGDPNAGWYNHGTVVLLRATADEGYRVRGWYDANDVLLSIDRELEIIVDSNETIALEFELTETIAVRGTGDAIQQAIDVAKSGDTIVVYAGTYDGGIDLRGKDITVVSSNPDDANIVALTIIDCNGSTRGFIFINGEDANTVVDGLTVINGGIAGENGGGMYIGSDTSPMIVNMVIRDCIATGSDPNDPNSQVNGGGIYVDANSSPTFINVTIINCSADEGGGAFCDFNSAPIFEYCTFIDNTADFGGGLSYDANCVSQVIGCTFVGNSAVDPLLGSGGGLRCDPNSVIEISDCNFTENSAVIGGGLYGDPNSSVTVSESIFSENISSDYGGAMFWFGEMEITDCNIVRNTAFYGGGLFCAYSPETTITRTAIRYNRAALPLPTDPNALIDPNDPNDPNNVITGDPNAPMVVGEGGGMFCFATPAIIQDSIIVHNYASTSGGGLYLAGRLADSQIINCLITNNAAGRDGGGVSSNWYAEPLLANCTLVSNAAPGTFGEEGNTGFGGGLYVSYHSKAEVIDSIFWDNFALKGHEMMVGTGFEFNPRVGTLSVFYSDVKDGRDDVQVDEGCTLNWGVGNIDADPLFVDGVLDAYYLSQLDAGQTEQSLCVDAGSDFASDVGLIGYTTRVDEALDTGIVDMGYHHPTLEPCSLCDVVYDGIINFFDFAKLAERWLDEGCSDLNGWCFGTDITFDTRIDFEDVAFLADCWLVEDLSPPRPDPAQWETEPYLFSGTSISMVAETAIDAWGWDVQYYFECVRGNCNDSGWQDSREYTDGGLASGTRYGYRVKARDTSPRLNTTGWSVVRYAGEEDTTPPAALMWVVEPYAISPNSVGMVASAFDPSGYEFFFENFTIPGHDSGWQDEPNWIDIRLDPNTEYCYRVRARDKSPNQNVSLWSDTVCVITPVPPDTTPPTPNPMMWDPNDPNQWPTDIFIGPRADWDWAVTMTCVVAVDPSGPVEYYFHCIGGDYDSGWIVANTYTTGIVGRPGSIQNLQWQVKARDANNNETAWSTPIVGTRPVGP